MPAADDLIRDPDLEGDVPPIASALHAWPKEGKKSKKKAKKNGATKPPGGQEDAPRRQSITPPIAERHDVAQEAPTVDAPVQEPEKYAFDAPPASVSPPPVNWEEDTTAAEDEEPEFKAPASVRSPRLSSARLASPPVSPPTRHATLHNGPQQYLPSNHRRLSSTGVSNNSQRRESLVILQPNAPRPRFADPPPPHMPQPHFFGLPDIGLNFGQKQELGRVAGSGGCCRFDSFSDAGHAPSARKARDALLVGSDGGLDVYRVLPDKMEVVGRLEGLRGAVVGAKILPYLGRRDAERHRPLVAVIVHGLMVDDRTDSGQDDEALQELPKYYQTTVEVYSLQSQEHVATLYRSIAIGIETPVMGILPTAPKPIGDLVLDATGSFITLASGKSGEVFVFSAAISSRSGTQDNSTFRCVGKFWTSLQTGVDTKPATAANEPTSTLPAAEKRPSMPLFSLSNRWLAIVPPYTSAGISIQGTPISDNRSPSDIGSHMAPIQPIITCEVAGIDAEGTLSWLSRKAAQGLLNASQKGYELGMQGWKEWTQPAPVGDQRAYAGSRDRDLFPPTNGPADDPRRLQREPSLVSMIDLHKLILVEDSKPVSPPFATFALVDGCNYLAFSPDGLRLLTSTRKGEASTVWDLRNVAHGKTKLNNIDSDVERGPHVKPLHRIVRSSPSTVLDSVWSRDGDWLAMLTANGTVHLHEVPLRVPVRKRKGRSSHSAPAASDKAEPTVGVSAEGMSPPSSNGFWGTFKSGLQSVSTQVSAIRTNGPATSAFPLPTTFAGFREATTAARAAGGRAVARGISQGYSAAKGGASDIWNAEENKIRHKQLQQQDLPPRAGTMKWVERQSGTALAIVCGGAVHLHPVQRISRRKGDEIIIGLKHDRHAHKTFALPRLSPTVNGAKPTACTEEGPHGFWSLRHAPEPPAVTSRSPASGQQQSLQTTDEVETNPPYCPFHIDSRVNICAFAEDTSQIFAHTGNNALETWQMRGHGIQNEEPWLFGEALPTSIKMNLEDSSMSDEDEDFEPGGEFLVDQDLQDQSKYDFRGYDDDGDARADLMQSRMIVHPAAPSSSSSGQGEERISVSTTMRRPRWKQVQRRVEEKREDAVEEHAFDEDLM